MRCFAAFLCVVAVAAGGCSKERAPEAPTFKVRGVGLRIPQLPGWERDTSVETDGITRLLDRDQGGLVFRLVRKNAAPGSPRLDVIREAKGERPTQLDDFLSRNLREMSELEKSGTIRITNVIQLPMQIGPRRAYRVRHDYVLTGTQAAITQISALLVLDGRGVAVTVAGRTELFAPLFDEVDTILGGLSTPVPEAPPSPSSQPPASEPHPMVQPIDLGKVGGTPVTQPSQAPSQAP